FELFPHALAVNPNSFMSAYNLGHIYGMMNDLDHAEPLLRKAIALKPDYAEAHQNLAILLEQRGKLDEAIEHMKQALEIEQSRPPAIRANVALWLDQISRDIEEIKKASTQPATRDSLAK
ncbi:MAG TPA: tetratricopeptide repeat protein, partial [Tepidisphaeraceae bacterium]|nr:tetratricopeptide repeat protein [Tepidisphaeraceae bacterium]